MIDFVECVYDNKNIESDNNKIRAAFMKVLPLIIKNELTEKQRRSFEEKHLNNRTETEIAKLLNLTQPTISWHITSAKQKINNYLLYCYYLMITTEGHEEEEEGRHE